MGRTSGVCYYPSKGGYYTYINGARYCLLKCDVDDKPDGPNYTRAAEALLMKIHNIGPGCLVSKSVGAAIDRYLRHLLKGCPKCYRNESSNLNRFKASYGRILLAKLAPRFVENWADGQDTWGPSTKLLAIARLKACFSWNLSERHTEINPLADWKIPFKYHWTARKEECVLPDELVKILFATAEGPFRDFALALSRTGARPVELREAIPKNYKPADHAIIHRADETEGYLHKTAKRRRHGQRDRIIYLDPEVEEIVARNAATESCLFPDPAGKKWTADSMRVHWHFLIGQQRVAEWMEDEKRDSSDFVPYSFRHTYITRAIQAGHSIKLIADLCGTSVVMIERHYCHAAAEHKSMYEKFLSMR